MGLSSDTFSQSWDHHITKINMDAAQERKLLAAAELIKKVITSEDFKERVLNYAHNGINAFVDNKGLSNSQIYQIIMDGAETLLPEKNHRMDVEVELFHEKNITIGYTYPNTRRIWMNTKYFNQYTPLQVADNLMHEWIHKLGFDHEVKWNKHREHSVPYAIGYIVKDLCKKYQ